MPEFEEQAPTWMRLMIPTALLVVLAIVGCGLLGSEGVAPAVRDASNKRQVICDFVAVWAPGQPELKRLDELCKAGAELKAIAAAYAECPAEEK